MLKVLIIDDEPIVREGIKTIIDWENYGFSICGDASNGLDGLEKIYELLPDLVIVDIKMPVIDGFQMVEELCRRKVHVKVIILTGYSHFEYAKKAMNLGIKSYLLKPIEQEELITEIIKVYDEITSERREKSYISKSVPLTKEKVLENISYGNESLESVGEFNDFYRFDFPWNSYQIVLLKHDECEELRKLPVKNVRDIAREYIEMNNLGYVFKIEKYCGILLKNPAPESKFTIFEDIMKDIGSSLGGECFLATGNKVTEFDDIMLSFQSALQMMDKKSINVIGNVLTYIHKNLDKDIKMETLSRIFCYNSAYLGKMFKDHTGEYFNTYLDRVKMEKAMQLLKAGDKVYEAAEKVGYSNLNYFYCKFKKHIGLPPGSVKRAPS